MSNSWTDKVSASEIQHGQVVHVLLFAFQSRRSPQDKRLLRSQEAQSGRGIRIHKLGRETILDQFRWQLFLVVSVKLFSENLTRDALTFSDSLTYRIS